MLDTFQISETYAHLPDRSEFERNAWKPIKDKFTGEPTALCFNSAKDEGKPRLTISRNRNDNFIVRAEVSIGRWLHGSNLYLPTSQEEIDYCLDSLSEYVESKSGIVFNAHAARVTKVDFTRDFQVGENAVIPIIAKFARLTLARFTRICFDDTTVNFKNEAKIRTKEFLIYSKYHERLARSKNESEQEAAKGLIRLEISNRKKAVNRLAESLKLPSHRANYILTVETAEKVIAKAMNQLHFDNLLTAEDLSIEKLFELYGATMPFSLIGFLWTRDKFGDDLAEISFIKTSPKTLKRYETDCSKAGILTLE